jgi:hypothetical protein
VALVTPETLTFSPAMTDEALLLQHKLFELPKPAERTRKAVWKWYISARQFSENSQVELIRDDVVTIRAPAEEDRVSKLLSRRFPFFFLVSVLLSLYVVRNETDKQSSTEVYQLMKFSLRLRGKLGE